MTATQQLRTVARRLFEAQQRGESVPSPSSLVPGLDLDSAYAIQHDLVERLGAYEGVTVGWKVGMASAIGRGPGSTGPIYGQLLSGMIGAEVDLIQADRLQAPEIEGEIAFVIDRTLRGPGITAVHVLSACRGVVPALEILASRLKPGSHCPEDFVADNAFSALAVLGGALVPVDGLDLRLIGMVLRRNGEIISTGAGAQVLGHPAEAVAWLANSLAARGEELGEGQIVLSGSLSGGHPVKAGDTVTADFDRLGSVTATFA